MKKQFFIITLSALCLSMFAYSNVASAKFDILPDPEPVIVPPEAPIVQPLPPVLVEEEPPVVPKVIEPLPPVLVEEEPPVIPVVPPAIEPLPPVLVETGTPPEALPTTTGICNEQRAGFTKVDKLNLFFCDGSAWQVVLLELPPIVTTCSTGETGKYKTTQDKNLQFCNGVNWLSSGNQILSSCDLAHSGKMKFAASTSGVSKVIQYCNGANWLDMGKKSSGIPSGSCTTTSELDQICGTNGELYQNLSYAICGGTAFHHWPTTLEKKNGCTNKDTGNCSTQVTWACGTDGKSYNIGTCDGSDVFPLGVTLDYLGECGAAI